MISSPYGAALPSSWTHNASVVGQYGAGYGAITDTVSNAVSSLQYLTVTEWVLLGLAGVSGVAAAFFFQRWLAKGEGQAMPFFGARKR